MISRMRWDSNTLQPLGDDDCSVQITVLYPESFEERAPTGLLTVRGKDHDLTAEQFDALAHACSLAAARLRRQVGARYTVDHRSHGLVITGSVPLSEMESIIQIASGYGWDHVDGRLSEHLGVTMVLTNQEHGQLWRKLLGISDA